MVNLVELADWTEVASKSCVAEALVLLAGISQRQNACVREPVAMLSELALAALAR